MGQFTGPIRQESDFSAISYTEVGSELHAGQTLSIPKLALNANNAATFQPYNPSRVTGSLRSVLPAPVLAALSAQPMRRPAPP